MAKEREAHPTIRHSFIKFNRIGQRIAGRVFKFGSSDHGGFIVLRDLLIRDSQSDAPWQLLDSCAVGMLADIEAKVDSSKDVGKYLYFQYIDTEATARGAMKKLFRVMEISGEEFAKIKGQSVDMRAEHKKASENGKEIKLFPLVKEEAGSVESDFEE